MVAVLASFCLSFLLLLPPGALAQSYTMAVHTDSSSYVGAQTIHISGTVSPAPGPNTAVNVRVLAPNGEALIRGAPSVDGTTGDYSIDAVAGGTPHWIAGTYTVNATWGAYGGVISAKTTFSWSPSATTTTTSAGTTTSTATSTSSSTTTSAGTSSTVTTSSTLKTSQLTTAGTTTTQGSGGLSTETVVLAAAIVAAIAAVGLYLIRRRR